MKYIVTIFFASLFCQASSQSDCLSVESFEFLKQKIVKKIRSITVNDGLDKKEYLIKHIKELSYLNYKPGFTTNIENLEGDTKILSCSIIETYSWHSQLHISYIVSKSDEEIFYVSKIDHKEKSTKFLGKIESDYFSQMASYLMPLSYKGVGSDYIFKAQINSKHIDCQVAANSEVFEMNELFLVEHLLFGRNLDPR